MIKPNRFWFAGCVASLVLAGTAFTAFGQQDQGQGRRFDPAQMQERMMERYRETLEVKDDAEWKALQPLIGKVMEARFSQMSGMGRMIGRRGGEGDQGGPRRFGPPNPEADALEKALEAKGSNAELKAAVEKYNAARKAKQAELEKAQADLRKVLSVRQEALATLNGIL